MTLSVGPNLGLLAGGAQGEQHYQELLRLLRGLDGLVMLSVLDRDLAAPPAAPSDGARYLVAAGATGPWAGKSAQIARYTSTTTPGWEFFQPHEGWFVHVDDEDAVYRHTGSGWEKWQGPASAGWAAATGPVSRAAFDTATVTTSELAQRVKALLDDLTAQGRLYA